MSVGAQRVVLWVLGVFALVGIVAMGHASWEKEGIFTWEFLAFFLSVCAFDQTVRSDERLKMEGN